MQRTSEVEKFPFLIKDMQYYELKNFDLIDLGHDKSLIETAYLRARNNESKLYVTWHGTYRTDLFLIDNLFTFGQALGLEQSTHIHDIEWNYYDNDSRGGYATLNVNFKCGCRFDDVGAIEELKRDLLIQKGWEMSKSCMGGYNGNYIIRVLKSSIKE